MAKRQNPALFSLVTALVGNDISARNAALDRARRMESSAIFGWADLCADSDPAIAKAARRALEAQVHFACRPAAPPRDRESVAAELVKVASLSSRPRMVRSFALTCVGYCGDRRRDLRAIEVLLSDPQIGPDAKLCADRLKRS